MRAVILFACVFGVAQSLPLCDSLSNLTFHRLNTAAAATPIDYKWKFVVLAATGRSGSTTLMRYLNTIPGFHFTGENKNALFGLMKVRKALKEMDNSSALASQRSEYIEPHVRKGPWYNTFKMEVIDEKMRDLVQYTLGRSDCVSYTRGFKEIRIFTHDIEFGNDSWDHLYTLMQLEPKTAVVFLTRDVNMVVNSSWWQYNRRRAIATVSRQQESFHRFHEAFPRKSFVLDYTDIISYSTRLQGLFEFLGAPYIPQRVREINKVVFGSDW